MGIGDEVAREGNRELARFLKCSLRTACRYAKAMRKTGVVFKWNKVMIIKGKRVNRQINYWFPSAVMSWMAALQRARDARKVLSGEK